MSKVWSPWRWTAIAAIGVALAGAFTACASRAVPASFPRDAAVSPEAVGAPPARVGAALAEDPPMPGEPASGWPGLDEHGSPASAPAMPDHHHHQGGEPPHHEPGASARQVDGGSEGGHAH